MQAMLDAGIATRRGIMCAHREAGYAGPRHAMPNSRIRRRRRIIASSCRSIRR